MLKDWQAFQELAKRFAEGDVCLRVAGLTGAAAALVVAELLQAQPRPMVVIVSSLVAVRRRFPYEAWHVIHLLTYVAVLVAIPHQLSVGRLFVDGTLQRTYWLALYVVVATLLIVYRFLLPIVRSLRHSLRVRRVVQVADGVVSIELSGRRLRELGAGHPASLRPADDRQHRLHRADRLQVHLLHRR